MGSFARAAGRRAEIERLSALVGAIEARERGSTRGFDPVGTGWPAVDGLLEPDEGLAAATLHEWFGLDDGLEPVGAGRGRRWVPPLALLRHLAARSVSGRPGFAFWVGRPVWPYPPSLALAGVDGLLSRSVFVDPPDDATRLWAIDLVLRCPAARVVVADARRLTMAASRRLQLAAESGGALALLARPVSERSTLSAASTRWLVRRAASPESSAPRWSVSLLRRKPGRGRLLRSSFLEPEATSPSPSAETALEWDHAACAVVEPSHAAGRPDAAVPTVPRTADEPLRPAG